MKLMNIMVSESPRWEEGTAVSSEIIFLISQQKHIL